MTPSVPLSNVLCSFFFGRCLQGRRHMSAVRLGDCAWHANMAAPLALLPAGFWNLLSGFLIPIPAMPGYWVWAAWLNPVMW